MSCKNAPNSTSAGVTPRPRWAAQRSPDPLAGFNWVNHVGRSHRSTQPSIPNRVSACLAGVLRRDVFTCVGWQVTPCDLPRQVTRHSCEMEFH